MCAGSVYIFVWYDILVMCVLEVFKYHLVLVRTILLVNQAFSVFLGSPDHGVRQQVSLHLFHHVYVFNEMPRPNCLCIF